MRVARGVLAIAALAVFAGCAAEPPPWERANLKELAAPWPAGTTLSVRDIAVAEDAPGTLLVATSGPVPAAPPQPVVLRSTDGGQSWGDASQGFARGAVDCLAVAAGAPGVFYAGTSDGGVFRTTDAGGTWEAAGSGLPAEQVTALAVDPNSADTVFAGFTDGAVFKSIDGGTSWNRSDEGLAGIDVTALSVPPGNGQRVLAGTYDGVFRSTDAGATWAKLEDEWIKRGLRVIVHPKAQHIVYVLTDGGTGFTGLVMSRNAGGSWRGLQSAMGTIDDVALDAADPYRVYALANGRVYRSDNLGYDFWAVSQPGLSGNRLVLAQSDPPVLYVFGGGPTYYLSHRPTGE